MNEDEVIQEYLDKILSKKNSFGYFFIVGEVVHPFYLESLEDFDLISEQEAWEIICDGLLDAIFSQPMKNMKNCFIRGKVTDKIEVGNLSTFYTDQVKKIFKAPEDFPVTEDTGYRIDTSVSPETFIILRNICKHIPYLAKLPWEVKNHLASHSFDAEKKIIKKEMIEGRLHIVRARLGALKRQNAIEAGQDNSTS